MKAKRQVLLLLGISFSAAIIIFLVTPFFMKSEYHINKTILIKSQPETIYNSISDLNKLAEWSTLISISPKNESYITENTLFWKNKEAKLNTGEISILKKVPYSSVQLQIKITDYKPIPQPVYTIEKKKDGTLVTIIDHGDIPYFMRYFAIEEAIAMQYQKGLDSLKKYAE